MMVGGYTLHLYCDCPTHTRQPGDPKGSVTAMYTGEHGSTCRGQARRDGWLLRRDGSTICPRCATTPQASS